jgi:hypothetical protein
MFGSGRFGQKKEGQSMSFLLIYSKSIGSVDQLPLDPPVLIGFLLAPEDFVFAFAMNLELPPACTFVFALVAVFLSATFLLIANPILYNLNQK